MTRKILLPTLILLAAIALSVTPNSTASLSGCNGDKCCECELQCVDEAEYVRTECWRKNGWGSLEYCNAKAASYVTSCKSMFCQYGGTCSGGGIGPLYPANDSSMAGFDETETCLLNAHQARQECGDSAECKEEYNSAIQACAGQ